MSATLVLSRRQELRDAADGFQGVGMGHDPVQQALRQVASASERLDAPSTATKSVPAPLGRKPVHDDRHRMASMVRDSFSPPRTVWRMTTGS